MPDPITFQKGYYETNEYVPQHITAEIDDANIRRIGANLSSRMVLTVEDELGHQVKGFFTENEYNNLSSIFATRFRPILENPKCKDFRPLYDALMRNSGKMKTVGGMIRAFDRGNRREGESLKAIANQVQRDFKNGAFNKPERLERVMTWFHEDCGVDKDTLLRMSSNRFFRSFLKEMFTNYYSASQLYLLNVDDHDKTKDTSINKRNNAMYDYAKLLGAPELVAQSSSMTLKRGDQFINGTFMVNAKGESRNNIFSIAQQANCNLEFTGKALRDISNIQVLDYLCANLDRHQDNMFYQYQKTDDGKVQIIGAQGIDNDASFGTVEYRFNRAQGYMSGLDDIMIMDADTAKGVLNVDPEQIEERLHLAELSAEEISAAKQRLGDLQQRLKENKITIIEGEAAWDNVFEKDTSNGLNRVPEKLILNTPAEANIYHMVNAVQSSYHRANDENSTTYQYTSPSATQAKATEIVEDGGLQSQFVYFSSMQKKLSATSRKGAGTVIRNLDAVMNTLANTLSGRKSLNDMERNLLAEQLKALGESADEYAKEFAPSITELEQVHANGIEILENRIVLLETGLKQHTLDDRYAALEELRELRKSLKNEHMNPINQARNRQNDPKNLAAFCRFARESVQRDAIEREMNLASYQAYEIARKNAILFTANLNDDMLLAGSEATYDRLKKELSNVDSMFIPSSREFKDMMTAFDALKNAPDKIAALGELKQQTERYLAFKEQSGPNGEPPKLSDYAKKRVEYAKNILGFAEEALPFVIYQKEAREIAQFSNHCAELVNNYRYAEHFKKSTEQPKDAGEAKPLDPEEAKKREAEEAERKRLGEERLQKAKDAILLDSDAFKKGIEKIEAAAAKYPADHDMQILCHQLMNDASANTGSIHAFAELHAELVNSTKGIENTHLSAEKPYASAGVSPSHIADLKKNLKASSAVKAMNEAKKKAPEKDPMQIKGPNALGS